MTIITTFVNVFFYNNNDNNVQTLDNFYDGIANGHLEWIITTSLTSQWF